MREREPERLADLSRAVRDSSLKRLRAVPEGREDWRPVPAAMSFADVAQHLIDCDKWLSAKLKNPDLTSITGHIGTASISGRGQYESILKDLEHTGNQRATMLMRITDEDLARTISDDRFGREVSIWWLIVRGNLDHEIHHRGQIATYLRVLGIGR